MKNFLIAGTTFVTFTVSTIMPIQARELNRLDGQPLVAVQSAIKDYSQKHSLAFNSLNLAKEDADFVEGYLLTSQGLPSLSLGEGKFYLNMNGENVEIAKQGLKVNSFLINGRLFTYNSKKSLEQNAVAIRQLLLTREVGLLDGLFVPSAEAINTLAAVGITAVVAAIAIWIIVKNKNDRIGDLEDQKESMKDKNASLRDDNKSLANENDDLKDEIKARDASREAHRLEYHSSESSSDTDATT